MMREVPFDGVGSLRPGDLITGTYNSLYGVDSKFENLEVYAGSRSGEHPHVLGRNVNDLRGDLTITKVMRDFGLPETHGSVCWIKTDTVTRWTLAMLVHEYSSSRDVWRIPTAIHRNRQNRSVASVLPQDVTEFKVVDTGTPIEVVNGSPGPVIDPSTNTPRRVDGVLAS